MSGVTPMELDGRSMPTAAGVAMQRGPTLMPAIAAPAMPVAAAPIASAAPAAAAAAADPPADNEETDAAAAPLAKSLTHAEFLAATAGLSAEDAAAIQAAS